MIISKYCITVWIQDICKECPCQFKCLYNDDELQWYSYIVHILLQIVISFVHVGILIQKIEELGDCRERDGFSHG